MNAVRAIVPIGLAGIVFATCAPDSEPEETARVEESAEPLRPLVETVVIERAPFREHILLTGETEPDRTAVLTSQVPGRIVALDVEEGEPVVEGARVLRIDTASAAAQRAQLETQAASLDRDIARARELQQRGIGTTQTVDTLETQRALVTDQLRSIDVAIAQGSMRAPIGGIVVQKLAEVGEFANPGVPLARIVDIDTIVVRVGLPEREITFVREGMDVEVTIEATGDSFVGTLARIGVEAHPASRTFPLEIRLANADRRLRAGMRATVVVPKRDFPNAVVIPRDAVLQGIDGAEVLVAEGGIVQQRTVTIGPGTGGFVVVESGLEGGEALVVRGHRLLVPGESVRTVDLGRCCGTQLQRYLSGGPSAIDATVDGPLGG